MMGFWLLSVAVLTITGAAAVTDWKMRRIPNVITVPAAILGVAYHALFPSGLGIVFGLSGLAVGFLLLLLPYILGGGGMGDVKLLAALGSWLGPYWILVALASGTVVAAVLALVMLVLGKSVAWRPKPVVALPSRKSRVPQTKKALPFAIPLALGTWVMMGLFLVRGGF
ncbi:A24 family peptidase [Thermopirellula anaerolimosa]